MIDFAHAVPVDGDGEDGTGPATAPGDTGYLHGLSNVSSKWLATRLRQGHVCVVTARIALVRRKSVIF